MNLQSAWELVRDAGAKWWADNAPRLAASLAFYTMLSLAPLLVIVVAVAGWVFGPKAAEGGLTDEMKGMVGQAGADVIQAMLANAYQQGTQGTLAAIAGVVMLVFGATGVFAELQDALNMMWKAPPPPGNGIWAVIKGRFLSFALIMSIAFLLLVSLTVSALLSAVGHWFGGLVPGWAWLLQGVHFVLSLALITVLFALIFKVLPNTKVGWGDVWIGAAATAVLFTVGKWLIGLYLGGVGFAATYGAAGSLAVFLVWVYYSALIVFFGAEFTYVFARRYGTRATAEASREPAAAPAGGRVSV